MQKYKVLGTEGESVEIAGEQREVGSVIELDTTVVQPYVDEGKLELVTE